MPEKIKLTFLGTSDAIPSVKRNHTAVLLTYKGENILVDCGEGTQRQFRKAGLNPCRITRILLTHKHSDHSLGLMGLLQTMNLSGNKRTLQIYGPKGIKKFIIDLFRAYGFKHDFNIKVHEVSGKFLDEKDFFLEAATMKHGVNCNAYSFVVKDNRRIDKTKLKKSKLPLGPLIKKLKEGKNVKHKGKTYKAKDLTFIEAGKKVTLAYDTADNVNLPEIAKGADLFICESSYMPDLKDKAKRFHHMAVDQTARAAKKAKAKKLILVHISQRHEKKMKEVLAKAKKIFKNSHLVKDLDVVVV